MRSSLLLLIPFLWIASCQFSKPNPLEVNIDQSVSFHLLPPKSFQISKAITQEVTIRYSDSDFTFITQIEIDSKRLIMVGLTPIGYPMFSIILSENSIQYERSPNIPKSLNPKFILADFQLIYSPIKILEQNLNLVKIFELNGITTGKQRNFTVKGKTIINIEYEKPSMWDGQVIYKHLNRGYSLIINTHSNESL